MYLKGRTHGSWGYHVLRSCSVADVGAVSVRVSARSLKYSILDTSREMYLDKCNCMLSKMWFTLEQLWFHWVSVV